MLAFKFQQACTYLRVRVTYPVNTLDHYDLATEDHEASSIIGMDFEVG